MYIIPSTPFTCCSIGAATVSATTWALAPGYEAETSTVGGVISGYCAMGKVQPAMLPASTMTIDSTEAKIGRLMKNWENTRQSLKSVGSSSFQRRKRVACYLGGWRRPGGAGASVLRGLVLPSVSPGCGALYDTGR